MVDVRKLRGHMIMCGYTFKSMSKELDMTERTFSNKMKRKEFGSVEIEKMIDLLNLDKLEAIDIFFAKEVT